MEEYYSREQLYLLIASDPQEENLDLFSIQNKNGEGKAGENGVVVIKQLIQEVEIDKKKKDESEDEEEMYENVNKKPNPLDLLPKSSFSLEDWKRIYSKKDTRNEAIPWFWQHFDPEGFSIWTGNYNYNDENDFIFKTCGLVAGFTQRLESLRKYGFGTILIFGKESPFDLCAMFVFRGQDMPAEVKYSNIPNQGI